MSRFCDDPVLVICEVQPKNLGLPITSYFSKEEVKEVMSLDKRFCIRKRSLGSNGKE